MHHVIGVHQLTLRVVAVLAAFAVTTISLIRSFILPIDRLPGPYTGGMHFAHTHAGASLVLPTITVVLADAAGITTTLAPLGEPRRHQRTAHCPIGARVETTWTWNLDGGHSVSLAIGALADGTTARLAFRNGRPTSVRLRELRLAGSLRVEGDPKDWLLTTFAYSRRVGTLAEQLISSNEDERRVWAGFGLPVPYDLPAVETAEDGRWRSFQDYAICSGAQGALALGAVGDPEATLRIDVLVEGALNSLVIASEMSDVEVAPGAWRHGQELAVLGGVQAEAGERLLRWVAATHGARTHRGAAAGWCSWYHHGAGVAASDARSIADHVRASGLPMPVIQIDDGFQRQVGDWACNARFAAGWAPVIERIRAAGSVPGVWLAPLAIHESTALFREHPEWLQRDVDGAIAGEANNWGPRSRWLDPTHPGAAAWIRQLIREHREQGFRYFKIDFNTVPGVSCAAPKGPRLHDRTRTAFQALRDLYRLYREEMGEDSYLLACLGFNRAVVGHADAARIGPDSAPRWQAAHPCCIHECIRAVGQNAQANGILFANDPDVSYTKVRGGLSEVELRTWHGFVGLLGGLSLISEPLWIDDQICGEARFAIAGERLELNLRVTDHEQVLADPPWFGSSADLFVEVDGAVRQFWLQPELAGRPARALRRDGPALVEDGAFTVASALVEDGWTMTVSVPLVHLGLVANTAGIRCEVKVAAVPGRSVPAMSRSNFTAFGTLAPWEGIAGYGQVTRGSAVRRDLAMRGWKGTDRNYELITPPCPERAISLDGRDPEHRRFGFTARRPWGDSAVVQVWNPQAQPADIDVDIEALLGRPCHVWSFWDGVYHGVQRNRFTVRGLAPHGSAVLRLTPVEAEVPAVIGSDLHLGCGAAELAEVAARSTGLRIVLHDAGARNGSLWVAWSGRLRLVRAEGCRAEVASAGAGLWRVTLGGRQRGTSHRLDFDAG